jgi:hypothetical protein
MNLLVVIFTYITFRLLHIYFESYIAIHLCSYCLVLYLQYFRWHGKRLEDPIEIRPPQYALVTFGSLETVLFILGGKEKTKFEENICGLENTCQETMKRRKVEFGCDSIITKSSGFKDQSIILNNLHLHIFACMLRSCCNNAAINSKAQDQPKEQSSKLWIISV